VNILTGDFELPVANPIPIERMYWTTLVSLIRCPKQVEFDKDPDLVKRKSSELSLLGELSHSFREELGNRPRPSIVEAETLWQTLEAGVSEKAAANPNTLAPVPASSSWPNYWLTRTRSIELAVSTTEQQTSEQPKKFDNLRIEYEAWMRPQRPDVGAKIDQVISTDSETRLVEFKTGATNPDHEKQLHFYAGVYKASKGKMPDDLLLEYLGATKIHVATDEETSESLINQAINEKDLFNHRIRIGQAQPANPSRENCKYCQYKPICSSYLSSNFVPENNSNLSVLVRVKEVGPTGKTYVVESLSGDVDRNDHILALPENSELTLDDGKVFALEGLYKQRNKNHLFAKWNSCLWDVGI
jgi:CRISPR/Cas system-associated exonuclease Cas4 (RecB family)